MYIFFLNTQNLMTLKNTLTKRKKNSIYKRQTKPCFYDNQKKKKKVTRKFFCLS